MRSKIKLCHCVLESKASVSNKGAWVMVDPQELISIEFSFPVLSSVVSTWKRRDDKNRQWLARKAEFVFLVAPVYIADRLAPRRRGLLLRSNACSLSPLPSKSISCASPPPPPPPPPLSSCIPPVTVSRYIYVYNTRWTIGRTTNRTQKTWII